MDSSKIIPTNVIARHLSIDLFLWEPERSVNWAFGETKILPGTSLNALEKINTFVKNSRSDYILFAANHTLIPESKTLEKIVQNGIDLAHVGPREGATKLLPELDMLVHDWSMVSVSLESPITSWHMGIRNFLVRRDLLVQMEGLDTGFGCPDVAALDLGYRCFYHGALIEYRPELLPRMPGQRSGVNIPVEDLYYFILRHFGRRWAKYVAFRRILQAKPTWKEIKALRRATETYNRTRAPEAKKNVWYGSEKATSDLKSYGVSVIIPTLGRYPYLKQALQSIRDQNHQPQEVLVIDQNPDEYRRLDFYDEYKDLNLQVIWQSEQGQSLARNAGLEAASHPFVLFFDDDSFANPDLIEAHLRIISDDRFHISTGASYPPPPTDYVIPAPHNHKRIAITFDTGNSLLPTHIAQKLGGLDRGFDFGPGADLDFGTRLYLSGYRIALNPNAIRIHYKAPSGGLRQHGAIKYNTDASLLAPFPPVTKSYYGLLYLQPKQQMERIILDFFTSKFPISSRRKSIGTRRLFISFLSLLIGLFFLPIKYYRSKSKATLLLDQHRRSQKLDS